MAWAGWSNVGAVAWLSASLLGCTFDSNANGGSGGGEDTEADGTGTTTTSPSTMSGSGTSATSSNPSDPTSTNDPTSPSTTTNDPTDTSTTIDPTDEASSSSTGIPEGVAVLQLSEGFDFGLVALDGTASHVFTLTNVGDETATAVSPVAMAAPFSLGPTDCGAELEPDASCMIEVVFAPVVIGPYEGSLSVAYHDSMADQGVNRDLLGGGEGQTRNLVENPGGEDCDGGGPEDWEEVVGENWTCSAGFGGQTPHSEGAMFFPASTPDGTEPDLAQTVDLPADIVPLVADGLVAMRFAGWSTCVGGNDDPRRFRLEFLDGAGAVIGGETWDSGWNGTSGWVQSEEIRVPASATEGIRVHLDCDINVSSNCSAMFDDLELRFLYPPP